MFNDQYGLTQAVLEGRKTMTRRLYSDTELRKLKSSKDFFCMKCTDDEYITKHLSQHQYSLVSRYSHGEVVAVAQSYKDIYEELKRTHGSSSLITRDFFRKYIQGGRMPVSNKMFVKPDLMPHKIRITDIKVERLQDISYDDCIEEGVTEGKFRDFPYDMFYPYKDCKDTEVSWTAEGAFSKLINKVSGKGTWESNPWVFAYTFELVK